MDVKDLLLEDFHFPLGSFVLPEPGPRHVCSVSDCGSWCLEV